MFGQVMGQFGFRELWHPEWIVLTVLIAIIYSFLARLPHEQTSEDPPLTLRRKISFFAGLLTLYIVSGSPLALIGSKFLFSVHMALMSLYLLVMPPLILIGIPGRFYRRALKSAMMRKWVGFFTNPFFAIVFFNGLLSFYHMPFIFNKMSVHPVLDYLYVMLMLFAAFCMWWPIVGPVPYLNRISELPKLAYIAVNGILLYPVCALLFLSTTMHYDIYLNVPQLFQNFTPLDDQQLGGVVMKVIQEGSLGVALGITVYQWFRRESSKEIKNPMEAENEERPVMLGTVNQAKS
jgi:putative membrane protein